MYVKRQYLRKSEMVLKKMHLMEREMGILVVATAVTLAHGGTEFQKYAVEPLAGSFARPRIHYRQGPDALRGRSSRQISATWLWFCGNARGPWACISVYEADKLLQPCRDIARDWSGRSRACDASLRRSLHPSNGQFSIAPPSAMELD